MERERPIDRETDPDVEELVDGQMESFVVGVRLGNVVEVSASLVGHFDDGMPARVVAAGRRQSPADPDGQLGALLVEPRHARHVDE